MREDYDIDALLDMEETDIGCEVVSVVWNLWSALDMLEYYEKKYMAATAYRKACHYYDMMNCCRGRLGYALHRYRCLTSADHPMVHTRMPDGHYRWRDVDGVYSRHIISVLLPRVADRCGLSLHYAEMQLYEHMEEGIGRAYEDLCDRFPEAMFRYNFDPPDHDPRSTDEDEDPSAYAPDTNRVPFIMRPAGTAPREQDQWDEHEHRWLWTHSWEERRMIRREGHTWHDEETARVRDYREDLHHMHEIRR